MRSLTLDVLVDRYAAVSDANRRRLDALAGLLDRFASQGIEVMLLKGPTCSCAVTARRATTAGRHRPSRARA
ncbi:MAG: hypothetical protein U0361_23610 [Nitrospiraceae bacterium]